MMTATQPRTVDVRTSGFQYLFNVRRMAPEGPWSATWRAPDSDLALTTFMPENSAQEIILADAEPELQPGAPETLQYFLARNALPIDDPGSDLSSTYITVSEPHRGPGRTGRAPTEAAHATEHAWAWRLPMTAARTWCTARSTPRPAAPGARATPSYRPPVSSRW